MSESTTATAPAKKTSLYAEHTKVYPKQVSGQFRRLKWIAMAVLLGIYYIVPWLRWDRGEGVPDQAVLVDMAHRRAYFFWIEIWPQEVYYLAGLLILGAIGLFLVTSLLGRVWCGFTCPQTVWTDLYMWVERKIEGDRNARMKLDKGPATAAKLQKKAAKHAVWLVIAALTGGAWIMYFNDAPTVLVNLLTGAASMKVYFFFGLFTAFTYLLAGFAREQVCTYMCPWPRFQAAMLDEDSMIVTYETWRGEPRGKKPKDNNFEGRGDCIDCNQCVVVCPTGIDIRKGNQLECIGCALCVDACNDIMAKIGRPPNLITYDSIRNTRARSAGAMAKMRLVRPRTILYAGVLLLVAVVMVTSLAVRAREDITVLHERSPLFVTLSDGGIRNGYTVKILNMERRERVFDLSIENLPGATMTVIGEAEEPVTSTTLTAAPDNVTTFRVYVTVPKDQQPTGRTEFDFRLKEIDGPETVADTLFMGPRT